MSGLALVGSVYVAGWVVLGAAVSYFNARSGADEDEAAATGLFYGMCWPVTGPVLLAIALLTLPAKLGRRARTDG